MFDRPDGGEDAPSPSPATKTLLEEVSKDVRTNEVGVFFSKFGTELGAFPPSPDINIPRHVSIHGNVSEHDFDRLLCWELQGGRWNCGIA